MIFSFTGRGKESSKPQHAVVKEGTDGVKGGAVSDEKNIKPDEVNKPIDPPRETIGSVKKNELILTTGTKEGTSSIELTKDLKDQVLVFMDNHITRLIDYTNVYGVAELEGADAFLHKLLTKEKQVSRINGTTNTQYEVDKSKIEQLLMTADGWKIAMVVMDQRANMKAFAAGVAISELSTLPEDKRSDVIQNSIKKSGVGQSSLNMLVDKLPPWIKAKLNLTSAISGLEKHAPIEGIIAGSVGGATIQLGMDPQSMNFLAPLIGAGGMGILQALSKEIATRVGKTGRHSQTVGNEVVMAIIKSDEKKSKYIKTMYGIDPSDFDTYANFEPTAQAALDKKILDQFTITAEQMGITVEQLQIDHAAICQEIALKVSADFIAYNPKAIIVEVIRTSDQNSHSLGLQELIKESAETLAARAEFFRQLGVSYKDVDASMAQYIYKQNHAGQPEQTRFLPYKEIFEKTEQKLKAYAETHGMPSTAIISQEARLKFFLEAQEEWLTEKTRLQLKEVISDTFETDLTRLEKKITNLPVADPEAAKAKALVAIEEKRPKQEVKTRLLEEYDTIKSLLDLESEFATKNTQLANTINSIIGRTRVIPSGGIVVENDIQDARKELRNRINNYVPTAIIAVPGPDAPILHRMYYEVQLIDNKLIADIASLPPVGAPPAGIQQKQYDSMKKSLEDAAQTKKEDLRHRFEQEALTIRQEEADISSAWRELYTLNLKIAQKQSDSQVVTIRRKYDPTLTSTALPAPPPLSTKDVLDKITVDVEGWEKENTLTDADKAVAEKADYSKASIQPTLELAQSLFQKPQLKEGGVKPEDKDTTYENTVKNLKQWMVWIQETDESILTAPVTIDFGGTPPRIVDIPNGFRELLKRLYDIDTKANKLNIYDHALTLLPVADFNKQILDRYGVVLTLIDEFTEVVRILKATSAIEQEDIIRKNILDVILAKALEM